MSWYQLIAIRQDAQDPSFQGRDIERFVCPNDGEPYTQGPNGDWRCRFDGHEPDGLGDERR